MHLHCHLRDCILDVGPLNSFWCFSFERYNGILESMKKTWNSPESQLIHKFSNLQAFTGVTLPQSASPELIHCFIAMRDSKSALPDPIVIDGYAVRNYEMNISCPAADICMLKMDFHSVSLPGREKFMTEVQKDLLTEMYATVYGSENVHYIPLRHVQFHQVYVFDEAFTSKISRTTRSSMVVGFWPQLSSILKTSPCTEDIRVGEIQYFIIHKPILKSQSGQPLQQSNKEHMLAVVHWFQDHPRKLSLGQGIVLSATVTESFGPSLYIPLSRVMSRCAFADTVMDFEYGRDKVIVAMPLKRHHLF